MKTYAKRSDIPEEFTWDTKAIYSDESLWEADILKLKSMLGEIGDYRGKLGSSPQKLYQYLQFGEGVSRLLDKLYLYSAMKKDEDNANSHYQGMNQRIQSLAVEISAVFSFAQPEILAIDEEMLENWLLSENLAPYRRYFEKANMFREHTGTEREEEILAMAGEVVSAPRTIFSMLNNIDLSFPEIDINGEAIGLTHGNFIVMMENPDREVRRNAFQGLYSSYSQLKSTFGATLTANIKKNIFTAKVRNYPSSLGRAVYNEEVSAKVYNNMITVVEEKLPLFWRYMELRKRSLGVDELHLYDIYVPLTKGENITYSYDEAKKMVLHALAPLGTDYTDVAKNGFESGWVDVYENNNKTPGAYSSGIYDSMPYILMNYQDNLNSVFTLAHELGHSMHSYFTNQTQPYAYSNYEIFVAEVASTVNETLLLLDLLAGEEDKEKRLELVCYYLDQFRGTVFRQTMFAEFEKIIHETAEAGKPISSEFFSEIYLELNRKYYGDNVDVDPEIAMEWARIPHFYRSFYVYKYATGFCAASILADNILSGDFEKVKAYKEFLSGGSSTDPLSLLKIAGADMQDINNIKKAFNVFETMLDELEKLI